MLNNTKRYYQDQGLNCAETILALTNDEFNLGLQEKDIRIMAGFGGGMYEEDVCGVVSGAIAALSLLFPKDKLKDIVIEFKNQTKIEFSSTSCFRIKPLHRSQDDGCYYVIHRSYEILKEIIIKNK